MRNCKEIRISALSLAVQGALAAMFAAPAIAVAADNLAGEVATIRRPTNVVEIGVADVSKDSAKFGEYNGLNKSGGYFIGNASVRGGDAYEGGNGVTRWNVYGRDLGTTSRELGAGVDKQGQWGLSINHDELRHNITDTYQTPQQGSMGSNTFTLPANFGAFNGGAAPSARTLNATQLGAFHTEDVGTTRKNTSVGASFNFTEQLSLKFDFNHLAQSGAKLIAGASIGAPATTGTWRAEAVAILMNPTDYKTDNVNLALNWTGDKGHLSGSYFGSTFKDANDRLSWQNPMLNNATSTAAAGVYQTNVLSTAPDNQLHQFNLSGGYAFSPATKLAGSLSYGRNKQNASFLTGMQEIVLSPRSSLDGLVVTKHADLKLTHQATRQLGLTAALKYNERDNRSSSSLYQYWAINSLVPSATNKVDFAANAPYSNKKTDLELAGDYRIDKTQSLRLAYDYEKISRWCNNYALTSNCLVSPTTTEDRLGAKYKLKANDAVSLNAGYTYSNRKTTYDHNAVTPLGGLDTAAAPTDVNAQDYPGFLAVNYAPRKQDLLKAGVNWQANPQLEFALEGRYANDKYNDSTLGVQGNRITTVNLDATYSYAEDSSVSAYLSVQNSKKDMRIGAAPGTVAGAVGTNVGATSAALVAPTNVWTNKLDGDGTAFGITTKHKLMGGKLELTGDLSYSLDKSTYSTEAPYLATGATQCNLPSVLTCGTLPDIKNDLFSLKIVGLYALDKTSKVSVGFLHQRLKSDDYFYNAYQYGFTPWRVMPTNQQSGSYSVNVISASYIYSFK